MNFLSAAVSFGLGPEARDVLDRFYARVWHVGFWEPVAARAGADPLDDRLRLGRAIGAAAVGSLCTGCLLVGLGSWLVGGVPPDWWPAGGRGAWIAANVLVGAALVPWLWQRASRHSLRAEASAASEAE